MTRAVADDRPVPELARELRGDPEAAPPGELRLLIGPGRVGTAARLLRARGGRFVTMLEASRPDHSLIVAVALRGQLVVVRAPFPAPNGVRPAAIGDGWPAARWAERELAERTGLPIPLAGPPLTRPDPDRIEQAVTGTGAFTIPYGPIRSGVFESIQFMIETGGEDVLRLETRPFFKHRGLEARMAGMPADRAALVAERVEGIAGVAHAVAFSQAVERATGTEPPLRAERWRALLAELERIANHLDVIAKQAETTALFVAQARFGILKERVLRLQAALTGSRFARGIVVPGGVREPEGADHGAALAVLSELERDIRRDRRLFLGTTSMTDRLIGSGRLAPVLVEDHGAVGPVARGSGLSLDARHERPYGHYRRTGAQVATSRDGDAMARVQVRFAEITESLRIARQSADGLLRRDGEARVPLPQVDGDAFGWAEAPQGEVVYRVEIADDAVAAVHVASPSLRNWALFAHAFTGDVLTDFAFIEHSFGLSPAGADR